MTMEQVPAEQLTVLEQVARAVAYGLPNEQIAEGLGIPVTQALEVITSPAVKVKVDEYRRYAEDSRRFTKGMAHDMYIEAYVASENSSEMIKATDGLVKLHELIPRAPAVQVGVGVQINGEVSSKRYDQLSDAELIEIAGD